MFIRDVLAACGVPPVQPRLSWGMVAVLKCVCSNVLVPMGCQVPGYDAVSAAQVFAELMSRLGYAEYFIQVGHPL